MAKTLIIRFINEPGIVSKLIDWTTDSLFCHTEALSRDGKSWIGAHAGTGVQARSLDWCKPTLELTYELPVTDSFYEAGMTYLESAIGKPYNYMDILGMAIHARLGSKGGNVICSQLMTMFLMTAGIYPLNCLEGFAYLITPETLHLSPVFMRKRIGNVR